MDLVTLAMAAAMGGGGSGGGSSGGVLVVNDTEWTLDKTASEIMAAGEAGIVVIKSEDDMTETSFINPIVEFRAGPDGYEFYFFSAGESARYTAATSNDYPSLDDDYPPES